MRRKHHSRYILILFFSAQILIAPGCDKGAGNAEDQNIESLSTQFIDPQADFRPGAFWCWLNGNMTKEAISRDLREMSEKGMGRAEIWDVAAANNKDNFIPAGPAFLSDSSVALMKHTFDEGRKYGIKIGMVGSSGWNAGGSWVEPDWASKQLFHSELRVKGPLEKIVELPFPELPSRCPKDSLGNPLFYKEVAVLAVPYSSEKFLQTTNEIVDLSDQLSGNLVSLNLPGGDWIIMRFICSNNGQMLVVPSPKSNGLFIDFFDPESTKKHLKHIMDRLDISRGEIRDGGLAYVEFDSMELDEGIPWTDKMPEIFKDGRGYDILKYLPVLSGWKIDQESERFLYDWKKTISDQLILSHYITGREFLEEYGIDLVAEAGGPGPPTWNTCPVDALKALGNVTIPRGEFWVRHRDIFLVKEVASASHIYGRNIVDAESFTTWRRWKDSPEDLKKIVDRAFGEGLNCVTFHTFASTRPEDGLPGRTYHAGSDINTGNTWWNKSTPFMDYLARCSYLLQQGLFVADACYFYGDQAPNFWPAFHVVPEKIIPEDLGEGYDYDVVNSDVILNRMSVKDGKIVLPDGMSYSVLVLPNQDHMPLNVLRKLEEMVQEGATVIGRKPTNVPYLNNFSQDNLDLSAITKSLWGNIDGNNQKINHYGKGRVIDGLGAREVLLNDAIEPDFSCDKQTDIDYIHRRSGENDIYFIRNKTGEPYSGNCSFRLSEKFPEIWDPSTGSQNKIETFNDTNGRISIRLDLAPEETVFVVFTEKQRDLEAARQSTQSLIKTEEISGSWRVTFPQGWGAPVETNFDQLISWTDCDDEGIKYFSGTGSYHKKISISEEEINNKVIELNLGEICDVAEVFLNGQSAGILWKKPYQIEITKFVHPGENDLRIEIVNQWVNRLTGDMLSEPEDRFCKTNMPYVTSDDFGYDNWIGDSDETFRVKTSGLLGPVSIKYYSFDSNE